MGINDPFPGMNKIERGKDTLTFARQTRILNAEAENQFPQEGWQTYTTRQQDNSTDMSVLCKNGYHGSLLFLLRNEKWCYKLIERGRGIPLDARTTRCVGTWIRREVLA
jgi:hypothetical protein